MKQKFTHVFSDGRAATQVYEVDFYTRSYRFVTWEFSRSCAGTQLPAEECRIWVDEVDRHFSTLGFKPV